MKFTLSWLKEHLKTDATVEEIVEAMTLAGLEVEGVDNPAETFSEFSIAKVISAEPHPDADKLKVCSVDTKDGIKQIICGAPNARAGLIGVYAPLGAYIPGLDFSLDKKPRKIRGVESYGMLCSAKELELGADHDGIMDLKGEYTVGQPISDALGLDDPVIDFEVTPNRPDWLGVDSIARDLSAVGLGEIKTASINRFEGEFDNPVSIKIEAPDACPAFVARIIRGVKNGPSPQWLQDRLKAIGLRPISALVDITNFITYDRARPLHFYDCAKLQGDILVRYGRGETFGALDDKSYMAGPKDCAICDESGVIGLGGIVGGQSTGCDENTTDILIESAWFNPQIIRQSAKRLGVQSDAKYRFERGVDTGSLENGVELATEMVLDICGGRVSTLTMSGHIPSPPEAVPFNPKQVLRLTGLDMAEADMINILEALGFAVTQGDVWRVEVPTWRRDVRVGADLVEEIIRIAGFDQLQAESLPRPPIHRAPTATLSQNRTRLARRALALRGLSEAVSWSFVLKDYAELFGGGSADMGLENPISSDLDTMRPSALIHLLLAAQRNFDRGYPGAALFEVGPVYRSTDPDGQALSVAGLRRVDMVRNWMGAKQPDALSVKADVLSALSAMGAKIDNLQTDLPTGSYWHPGRSARLQMGPKNILADFGELHPGLLKSMDIEGRVVAFEIWPDNLPAARKAQTSKNKGALTLSDFMPVHRDFAFLVKEDVPAANIIKAARGADKRLIANVELFDVYQGAGIDAGYKSLAIDVTLAPSEQTLTDKDIEAVSDKIIAQVAKAGGTIRE